jgi:hypothetical protein
LFAVRTGKIYLANNSLFPVRALLHAHSHPKEATMAEHKEGKAKGPEIVDIDLTTKLLTIAHHSANDAGLRAVHAAARHQLMELNAGIQEQIDKVNKAQADKIAADEAKVIEDARLAKRKAEDEEATAAKKAEHKNEARHPA